MAVYKRRLINEINLSTFDPFCENRSEENRGYCAKEVSHVSLVITLVYRFACLNFRPAARSVIRHPVDGGKKESNIKKRAIHSHYYFYDSRVRARNNSAIKDGAEKSRLVSHLIFFTRDHPFSGYAINLRGPRGYTRAGSNSGQVS